MYFYIRTHDGCLGRECSNKTEFLQRLSQLIDNYSANGGTYFDIDVDSNAHWPWIIIGRYADGGEITVGGLDESACMKELINLQEQYGDLIEHRGFSDEDYVNGKYIGAENRM